MNTRNRLLTLLMIVLVLGGGLALDLANRGLVWRFAWSVTGEEEPVGQLRGVMQYAGNLLRPQPVTDAMTPIDHNNLNPYGINAFFDQEVDPAKVEAGMAMIADAGFYWIRQQFRWADIEIHGKGNFTDARNDLDGDGQIDEIDAWEKYDRLVDLAEQYGLHIQARIDAPPPWSRALDEAVAGPFGPPDNVQDYADFVAVFAQRYKGRINVIQVWNEPNIYPEWGNQAVNPEAYTDLLCRTYSAIQAVDPDIIVVAGALAPTQALSNRDLNDFIYLQRMYQAGAGACFDVLSVQGYGLNSGPTDRRMRPTIVNVARNLYIRDIMIANGDAQKPIWISEAAWNFVPSREEAPDIAEPRDMFGQVTVDQAAEYITQLYARAQKEWAWVGVVNYWYFTRRSDDERNQPLYYFRMVEPDFDPASDPPYTPLPIYDAMKTYIQDTAPTLYRGVHQMDDHWAVSYAPESLVVDDPFAQFGEAMQTVRADLRMEGTALRLRWRGAETLRVNDQTVDGVTLADGWKIGGVRLSTRAESHTITISADAPFLLDSVTVQDDTVNQAFPVVFLIGLGGVMVIFALWMGWQERRTA